LAYKYLAEAWRKPESSFVKEVMQGRVILWRKERAITRVEKPTRVDRARRLGYRDKNGYVVVRVRVRRAGYRKLRPRMGKRQKKMGVTKLKVAKSMKLIAEGRAAKKYPNLEVLNSYWVWQDGTNKWYEVILVDRTLLPELNLGKGRGRAFRGLTAAGRKARGLMASG
jgi:large subunit ribosomal protein L15e